MYRVEPVGEDISAVIDALPNDLLADFAELRAALEVAPWSVGEPYNPANPTGSRAATFGPDRRGWWSTRWRTATDGSCGSGRCSWRHCSEHRWHSKGGEDDLVNGLALCSLHHVLFDVGVLGLTEDRRLRVSPLYVARSESGRAIDDLVDRAVPRPRPSSSVVHADNVAWHGREVFKG